MAPLHQRRPHQRRIRQIEGADEALRELPVVPLDDQYVNRHIVMNFLHRETVLHMKRGAQRVMPLDQKPERLLQPPNIEATPQFKGGGHVIGRGRRIRLLQGIQPSLDRR